MMQVGQHVGGRYEVLARLGQGGMATVYRARDTRLLREVALKVMDENAFEGNATFYFHREARAVAALQHPHIIQIHDYSGPDEQPVWFVMELVDGPTLELLVQVRGRLSEVPLLVAAEDMADALAHAHEREVVHRDIKPSNVMVTRAGRTVLTDFGIAKAYRNPAKLGATLVGQQTILFGTPEYLAPEQVREQEIGPYTDVFSCGALLYTLATGSGPFAGGTTFECLERIRDCSFQPLAALAPHCAPEVVALIEGCLEADGRQRPAAKELATACRGLLHRRGVIDAREPLAAEVALALGADQLPAARPGDAAPPATGGRSHTPTALRAPATRRDRHRAGHTASDSPDDPLAAADEATALFVARGSRAAPQETTAPHAAVDPRLAQTDVGRRSPGRVAPPAQASVIAGALLAGGLLIVAGVLLVRYTQAPADEAPRPAVVAVTAGKGAPPPDAAAGTARDPDLAPAPPGESPAPPPAGKPSAASPDPAALTAPTRPDVATPAPGPLPGERPRRKQRHTPPAASAAAATSNEPATLTLLVKPWGTVYIDGQRMGNTPVWSTATLPPGRHEVRVENPAFGSRSEQVTLRPGEQRRLTVDLRAP